jgi:hypothetical protein
MPRPSPPHPAGDLFERLRRGDLTVDRFNVANLGSDTAKVQISSWVDAEAAGAQVCALHAEGDFRAAADCACTPSGDALDLDEATAKLRRAQQRPGRDARDRSHRHPNLRQSWHRGVDRKYLFEERASHEWVREQFRYRNAPIEKHTLVLVITQSVKRPTPRPACAIKRRDTKCRHF